MKHLQTQTRCIVHSPPQNLDLPTGHCQEDRKLIRITNSVPPGSHGLMLQQEESFHLLEQNSCSPSSLGEGVGGLRVLTPPPGLDYSTECLLPAFPLLSNSAGEEIFPNQMFLSARNQADQCSRIFTSPSIF